MKKRLLSMALFMCLMSVVHAGDYSLSPMSFNKPNAIFKSNEEIRLTVTLCKGGKPVTEGHTLRYRIKWEQKEILKKDVPVNGSAIVITAKRPNPGWIYFDFQVLDANGAVIDRPGARVPGNFPPKHDLLDEIGALIEPDQICTKVNYPADFEEYWKKCRAELDKVPLAPQLTKVDSKTAGVVLYQVEVPAMGGNPVTGYLALPSNAAAKTLPAQVAFQSWVWCDVTPTEVVKAAQNGCIALQTTWHGLPVGKPAEFYQEEHKKFNPIAGWQSREQWVFRSMYFRVMRALDFITSRPEWDGKNLLVTGGSLGGAQTIAAAALDKRVTVALVQVPAFSEFDANPCARRPSLPVNGLKGISWQAARNFSYYDAVNFARHIHCECYFTTGFADEVCPPSNVWAAYNNVPPNVLKKIYTNPRTGHNGTTPNPDGTRRLQDYYKNKR